jgi:hypothetical protein
MVFSNIAVARLCFVYEMFVPVHRRLKVGRCFAIGRAGFLAPTIV